MTNEAAPDTQGAPPIPLPPASEHPGSGAAAALTPRSRSANRRAMLAGAVAVIGMGYLAWSGLQSTVVYYLTVGELLGQGAQAYDRPVRVSGHILDGSLSHDAKAGLLRFSMADGSGSLPVVYRGVKPDMLGYSAQDAYQDVVVEGRLESDGVMHASTLIVKHGPDFQAAPGQSGPALGGRPP
jgi:cytochrome c-type biogenesis protein CcmE